VQIHLAAIVELKLRVINDFLVNFWTFKEPHTFYLKVWLLTKNVMFCEDVLAKGICMDEKETPGKVNGFLQDLTLTLDLVVVDEPDWVASWVIDL